MRKYPEHGLDGPAPDDLSWLEGSWKGRLGEETIEETWSPPGGGTLMGMFRWIKEDRVSFYELIVIEQAEEGVMMRIKHFSPGLKGWEEKDRAVDFLLVQLDGTEAVFFQMGRQDQWLVYRLDGPDHLSVFFHSEEDPQKSEQVLTFTR
jgi:hypothetical protein